MTSLIYAKSVFLTFTQSRCACVSCFWLCPGASCATHLESFLISLKFCKQCSRVGFGPLKGAMSALKALQRSRTKIRELQEGTKANIDPRPLPQCEVIDLIFHSWQTEKSELLVRPGGGHCCSSEGLSMSRCYGSLTLLNPLHSCWHHQSRHACGGWRHGWPDTACSLRQMKRISSSQIWQSPRWHSFLRPPHRSSCSRSHHIPAASQVWSLTQFYFMFSHSKIDNVSKLSLSWSCHFTFCGKWPLFHV